jgi:D-alanyl-D-alanine dipeptidase
MVSFRLRFISCLVLAFSWLPHGVPVWAQGTGLVELVKLDPTLKLDIRYATSHNFMHRKLYPQARAFLERPAAEALVRVQERLRKLGFGLMIFDGYRPWSITKKMWDETPASKHQFVADPTQGSRHNRGYAVDLTLIDLSTGRPVPMPSDYDEFSSRAYADYALGSPELRRSRDLLRREMEAEGFTVYPYEWWHFDYRGWKNSPILNLEFDDLDRLKKP